MNHKNHSSTSKSTENVTRDLFGKIENSDKIYFGTDITNLGLERFAELKKN